MRIPAGWGFDEHGDLTPGGKLGYVYDDEGDLLLAMRAEADLRKAFKLQGHIEFQGLSIAVENRKGSTRKWKDAEGNSGKTKMQVAYGYLKRTRGADSDEIDCFVGPDPRAENAYVVEQQNPKTGIYDEQKCFLGFGSQELAVECYRNHYDTPDKFLLTVSPMKMDHFKRWVGATAPAPAEGLQKGLRLVVPLRKARVPDYLGGTTSQAGNRAPGPGLGVNYLFVPLPVKKEGKKKKRYGPGVKELLVERTGEPIRRDKAVYEIQEPFSALKPLVIPDDFAGVGAARKDVEANMQYLIRMGTRNVGRPKNMAEIAEAAREPVLKKAGPYIGPRGGKWADAAHTIPWKPGTKAAKPGRGKLPAGKTPQQHVKIARQFLRQHTKALPALKAAMAKVAGAGAAIKGRVKTLESALGKMVRKPNYVTADKLQDGTGIRIIHGTVDRVRASVAALKARYRVVDEDDYIAAPLQNTYRSHHLILEDPKTGLQFEVQVRTQNQNTFADWAHQVYKPVDETQAKFREHPEIRTYEKKIADYFWALDTGAPPPVVKPPCTPVVKQAFGCL